MSDAPNEPNNERPGGQVGALRVARADYAPFGRWLDVELEKLVARWVHLAAPAATRRERVLRKPRR
ncbi:MAG TPA: hypothetical protein VND64_32765 [Pirellulales bacterium]|nr:hypothetical protein [Pirellulales bacterium]